MVTALLDWAYIFFFQRVSKQRSYSLPLRGWSLLNLVLNHFLPNFSILRQALVKPSFTCYYTGYYVLSFSSTELSDNPFMSFILSAMADLPAYPVIWGLMKIFGRRSLTGVSLVLGGLSVTSASLITNDIARYVIMIVIISDLRN